MGRKVDMKKIENVTRCQVTFSKRRSTLFKKAHEISVLCDVDIALIAFSPSARLTKFCSRNRIEDVIERFIDLPPDQRYHDSKNLEKKLGMLRQLGRITGEESKLHYLNDQIKHIELKVKKSTTELEILQANLRDYEPDPERDPSLAQLLWCEKNLKTSLQRVVNRNRAVLSNLSSSYEKFRVQTNQKGIGREVRAPIHSYFSGNALNWATQNPTCTHLLMQLDPWISPYSSRIRESILEDLLDREKGTSVCTGLLGASNNYTCHFPITDCPSIYQSGVSSTTPRTQTPPTCTIHAPIQERFGHEIPFEVQQYQEQTIGHHLNNLTSQNSLAPTSWFNSNPNEDKDLTSGNCNSTRNMNVNLPLTSERILSPLGCELLFSNTVAANSSSSNNNNDKNGGCDANEKLLAAPSQLPPLSGSVEPTMGNVSTEALIRSAANQLEDGSWEWGGLALGENLNLEDLEFLLCLS